MKSSPCPSRMDDERVRAWLAGDARAGERLLSSYVAPLDSFFYRRVGDVALAEDMRQDTLLLLSRAIHRFRFDSNFSTFLFGIANNVFLTWQRKTRRRSRASAFLESCGPLIPIDGISPEWLDFLAALRTLTPEELLLIEATAAGLEYAEIQQSLAPGVPLGTLRARAATVRDKLDRARSKNHGRRRSTVPGTQPVESLVQQLRMLWQVLEAELQTYASRRGRLP